MDRGSVLACSLQYALGRGALRARVRVVDSRPPQAAFERAVKEQELRLQLLIRLTPLSPTLVRYVLGAADVRFRGFFLALAALVPGYFVQVCSGFAGKHVARMAGRDTSAVVVHDVVILACLVACLVAMNFVTRAAKKAIERAQEA